MGATMTKVYLSEDVADTPSKAGQKPSSQSLSVAIASDELAGKISLFPPKNQVIIEKPSSEITTDLLGNPRQIKASVLFKDTSRYDLDPKQWSVQLSDTSLASNLPAGTESVVWIQRVNARAEYPGSYAEIKFVPESSAIQILNYPVLSDIGVQQSVLYSNRVFNAIASPIFVSMAVKMSLSDNILCSKSWGLLSGTAGYFFRIYGSGQSNNFRVGYRYTLGSQVSEVEILRSNFNGDRLDGTGRTLHTQTFTNIGMFGIEIGTAGYGARFWAYVESGNKAEWVLIHSLYNDSDSSQNRITDEESLPISFEVKTIGKSSTPQSLLKYGTSVASLGSSIANSNINTITASKAIAPSVSAFPILGIKMKELINNKKNFNTALPVRLNLTVSLGVWRILLIKNPNTANLNWVDIDNSSAIQYNINRNTFVFGGTVISSFLLTSNKSMSISLASLFTLNRSFLTAQYTNDAQFSGDYGQQFLQNSDTLWVCVVDANIPVDANISEVIWSSSLSVKVTATYQNSNSVNFTNLDANIYTSLSVLEV